MKKRFPFIPEKEPLPEHVTRDQVLAHLATLSKPVSIRELAHGLRLKHHGRRYLPRIIRQLEKSGEVGEVHGGRYYLAGSDGERRRAVVAPRVPARARSEESRRDEQPV